MNMKMIALATALAGMGAAPAFADIVRIDAVPYYGSVPGNGSSAAYVAAFYSALHADTPPNPAYTSQIISDWNGVNNPGSSTDLAYHDSATFTVTAADAGVWNFRIGVDFGWGGTLIVNGQTLETLNNDMWWACSYSNPTQFLQGSLALTPGTYTLNVYGMENCCNGGTQGQYLTAAQGATWQDFKTTAGAVPEISTWAMMLAGFAGLGLTGWRRARRDAAFPA